MHSINGHFIVALQDGEHTLKAWSTTGLVPIFKLRDVPVPKMAHQNVIVSNDGCALAWHQGDKLVCAKFDPALSKWTILSKKFPQAMNGHGVFTFNSDSTLIISLGRVFGLIQIFVWDPSKGRTDFLDTSDSIFQSERHRIYAHPTCPDVFAVVICDGGSRMRLLKICRNTSGVMSMRTSKWLWHFSNVGWGHSHNRAVVWDQCSMRCRMITYDPELNDVRILEASKLQPFVFEFSATIHCFITSQDPDVIYQHMEVNRDCKKFTHGIAKWVPSEGYFDILIDGSETVQAMVFPPIRPPRILLSKIPQSCPVHVTYARLPLLALLKMMSYLDPVSYQRMGSTCRYFYSASLLEVYWETLCIHEWGPISRIIKGSLSWKDFYCSRCACLWKNVCYLSDNGSTGTFLMPKK